MGALCYEIASSAEREPRGAVLPSTIVVEADGIALALYGDVPLLWFPTLLDLLRRYELDERDLVECPPESSRRAREVAARRRALVAAGTR